MDYRREGDTDLVINGHDYRVRAGAAPVQQLHCFDADGNLIAIGTLDPTGEYLWLESICDVDQAHVAWVSDTPEEEWPRILAEWADGSGL